MATSDLLSLFGYEFSAEWLTVKPLNTAAFVYLAGCLAYFVACARSGAHGSGKWGRFAGFLVAVAFVFHTFGQAGRWYVGGIDRPPWTNLYESLVAFAWMLSLFQIVALRKWRIPLLGAFVTPLIFLLMGMSVMTANKAVEPLIPALQSNWLKIHVVFGMISYAGFTTAGALAFLHLVRNRVSLNKIGCGLSLMILMHLGIAGGREVVYTGHFYMAKTVLRAMPDGTEAMVKDTYRESEGGPVVTRMEEVPGAHWPFHLSVLSFVLAAVFFYVDRKKNSAQKLWGDFSAEISPRGFKAYLLGLFSLIGFFVILGVAIYHSATLTLQSNAYLTMLLLMTFFISSVFAVMVGRFAKFVAGLPSAERLDELCYKYVLFGFPFQTLLLITGAIWAYYAWGRSWGWDPKETWALITWLCYLIYLHGKLLLNWKPNFLSVLALVGFALMVFAFLGVNLVLSGLHSYGAA